MSESSNASSTVKKNGRGKENPFLRENGKVLHKLAFMDLFTLILWLSGSFCETSSSQYCFISSSPDKNIFAGWRNTWWWRYDERPKNNFCWHFRWKEIILFHPHYPLLGHTPLLPIAFNTLVYSCCVWPILIHHHISLLNVTFISFYRKCDWYH